MEQATQKPRGRKLTAAELSALFLELHLVIRAGLPIQDGLMLFDGKEEDGPEQKDPMLDALRGDMDMGFPFSEALARSGAFPAYAVEMVAIGERTGRYESVFRSLSDYYRRQEELAHSLRQAVLYPAILVTMLLLVVLLLITEVLPVFSDVYRQLGAQMTGVASALLAAGAFIRTNLFWLLPAAALIAVGIILLLRARSGGSLGERLLSSGAVRRHARRARFSDAIAMGLASGLDFEESLDMADKLLADPELTARMEDVKTALREGEGFAGAVGKLGILTRLDAQMLALALRTGSADAVMAEIAQRSETELNAALETKISRVEPTLVIALSVIVGLILLSVMLPLAGILTSFGG